MQFTDVKGNSRYLHAGYCQISFSELEMITNKGAHIKVKLGVYQKTVSSDLNLLYPT